MKQHEAVVEAMRQNGGFATLGYLYQAALKIPGCNWGTKTPFASIRRIVQQHTDLFFKIRPGLWALTVQREEVLEKLALAEKSTRTKEAEFNHSYYQGLIVQIGNLNNFKTFVPNQDKNKHFLSHRLCDISTLGQFYSFTYEDLLRRARTVDVTWFGKRNLPHSFFEVEHSTDIQNSLLKFLDFQDFRIKFHIVADKARRREFEDKIARAAFVPIRSEVKFLDYEYVSEWHARTAALIEFEKD